MENRNGLIVDAILTHADGTAERDAALLMLHANGRHSFAVSGAFAVTED